MHHEIQTGAILIAQGTSVPVAIQTKDEAYVQGWQVARRLDRRRLIQTMRRAGWKLFSHDAILEIRVFGFDDNKTIRAAIRRIVATIRAKSFNCLEIKQVQRRRCFGFPYVLVSAHSWHIQEGAVLATSEF